jgi:hypothetical protein
LLKLRVKPTRVPRKFVICVNFKPTQSKGVFVSHDAKGESLVGLPGKPAGTFSGGDWLMIRASIDQLRQKQHCRAVCHDILEFSARVLDAG